MTEEINIVSFNLSYRSVVYDNEVWINTQDIIDSLKETECTHIRINELVKAFELAIKTTIRGRRNDA